MRSFYWENLWTKWTILKISFRITFHVLDFLNNKSEWNSKAFIIAQVLLNKSVTWTRAIYTKYGDCSPHSDKHQIE